MRRNFLPGKLLKSQVPRPETKVASCFRPAVSSLQWGQTQTNIEKRITGRRQSDTPNTEQRTANIKIGLHNFFPPSQRADRAKKEGRLAPLLRRSRLPYADLKCLSAPTGGRGKKSSAEKRHKRPTLLDPSRSGGKQESG